MFNPAVARLGAPPVAVVLDWLSSYDQSKGPPIDMSQAVPGYAAHPDIEKALAKATAGAHGAGYGPIEGEDALRDAYARHLCDVYDAPVDAGEIHITSGCNQAFVAAALAVAGHGDEVLMTRPCYFNHESTLSMLGVDVAYVDCRAKDAMLPDIDDIEAGIGKRTRAVALVSPNNPCGTLYPPELLDAIFTLCKQRGIWLIIDETYRDFLPCDAVRPHNLFSHADWRQTLVQLYSFSKSYCIPGHRIGAVAAGGDFVRELAKIIDNIQICAPRAPQMALAELIGGLGDWRAENRRRIAARMKVFVDGMNTARGWRLLSSGAYFGYASHPFDGTSSLDVARRMAEQAGVLAIPGTFFGEGQERHIRFAFANAGRDVIAALPGRLAAL